MSTLVRAESLSVYYSESNAAALRQTSLSIAKGEILAIVGESGSGKTTLLKSLAGLLEPTKGTIYFDGKPLPPPSQQLVPGHPDIRMVFQDFGLLPNMTVFENVWHMLREYERTYREERTQELIRRCQLTGLEDHMPKILSGGEKQRLALARALAEEPRLLLMDEPFGQLDAVLKQQLKLELSEYLKESHSTVVMVTHDLRDALGIADTISVMKAGEIVQSDSPQLIYEQPRTPYVSQLFGAVSILPTKFWKRHYDSIPANGHAQLGIRAEQVQIIAQENIGQLDAVNGSTIILLGTVVYTSYQGFYEEVVVRLTDEYTITGFNQNSLLSLGQTAKAIVNPTNLIPFTY